MSAYWPEFAQQGKERITVRQVRPWTAAEVPGCPRGPGSHIRGRRRSNPVVVATVEGKRYLVSMLGPDSDW